MFDEELVKFNEIFVPGHLEKLAKVVQENQRFAYYTTAETALKIIENDEIWLRNATVMNDFSEISYGLDLISDAFAGEVGKKFRSAVDEIFPDVMKIVENLLQEGENDWRFETYLACISAHDASEDVNGRLSMWRAYGDVALVVKNTPLVTATDLLGVYSVPVSYLTLEDYEVRLGGVAESIFKNSEYLHGLGENKLRDYVYHMLFLTAISTKHPGFAEEKEYRIFYRPFQQRSEVMTKKRVVLNGIPQDIWALPLRHAPEHGLFSADMPSLLDRIIIGPTNYPYVSIRAITELLEEKGVQNAGDKVVASDIPLRVN